MAEPRPRVKLPKSAAAGVPFTVRTRITHPMHTGLRHDPDGELVPRRIINRFAVRYNGEEVISVDLKPAVSADPYIEFEMAVPSRVLWNSNGSTMTARYTASADRSPSTRAAARRRPRTVGLAACAASGLFAVALLVLLPAAGAWSGDVERGRELYRQCKRCHQVGGGAEHRIGPHLNDLFGRAAGSLADFRYSPAMKAAGSGGLVWTETTLDTFLSDPPALVPRSRMSFAGMVRADDRRDLLAWLRGFSGAHSDLPPAGADRYGRGIRPRPAAPRHPGRP